MNEAHYYAEIDREERRTLAVAARESQLRSALDWSDLEDAMSDATENQRREFWNCALGMLGGDSRLAEPLGDAVDRMIKQLIAKEYAQ